MRCVVDRNVVMRRITVFSHSDQWPQLRPVHHLTVCFVSHPVAFNKQYAVHSLWEQTHCFLRWSFDRPAIRMCRREIKSSIAKAKFDVCVTMHH